MGVKVKTYSLDEPHGHHGLEAGEFRQAPAGSHQDFHAAVEAENGEDGHDHPKRLDHAGPDMTVLGLQRRLAVSSRGFGGFQDNDGDDLCERILEDGDPGGAWPVAFALSGIGFLLRFHSVEDVFAESPFDGGGGRGELHVHEEEGAYADCFVEGADRVDVAGDRVVVYLGQGYQGEDKRCEDDPDDLTLLFGRAVAAQVHRDESD